MGKSKPPTLKHPTSHLAMLISSAALGLALTATDAVAAPVRIDIPAQPLGSALISLGTQSDLQIVFNPVQLQNLRSPELHGEIEPTQALNSLLRGTGIQYQIEGSRVTLLAAAPTSGQLTIPDQIISGRAAVPEGYESYVPKTSNSASKTNTPLIEIPQSISVVTRKQMEDQGAQTVTDALRYVPGVKVEAYGLDPKGFDWLYIRGFNGQSTSDYLNGLRQQNNSYAFFRSEPYAFDRIDVVKGPSSTLFGQGDAGGIINRVSKKPEVNHVNEVQLSVGNYDRRQGQFDLGGALDDQQHFLYRVVGSVRDSNTQVEYDDGHEVKDDRLYIAPSFTWAPDEDTSLTFLSDFLRDRNGGSLFAYSTPNGHTTNTLMGDHSFNHLNQDQYSFGYEFRHRFDDTWEFRQNARYGQVDVIFQNLLPFSVDTSTGNTIRGADRFDQHMNTFALDNQLQADFQTGPFTHKLLTGVDYTWQDADVTRWRVRGPDLNVYNPVYGQPVTRPTQANSIGSIDYDQTIEQIGGYIQDQIKFDDHWILTAGGRYDYVRNDLDNHVADPTNQKDNAFTGRLGLTYLTEFGLAPYVSYSESFAPNTGLDSSGRGFDSSEAHQWEAGVKYQPTDAILMTLAAYDLTKTNVLTRDLGNTAFSVANGEQQSRGIEAEVKAKLDQNWDLIASYTYTKAEITKSNAGDEGNRPANVPKHMASAWLNYTFNDTILNGLSLGGGARYTGVLYGDNANTFHIDNYTLFDAGASYPLNKSVTVSVNAQNLLDEKYSATCDDSYECYPGMRRTLLTSVKYKW
ncbi:TonB-dependent siderophore receptor [Pseudomonas sp. DOAB1069]|uniref:TonB-dependent siderophore receptor n=2 Tax=Pseudomonas folii TaxID=2762593 RepID=A0ABR7AX68_9PSED|nr:TonB-dependent siderophore receptor [Pseudomonas folii]